MLQPNEISDLGSLTDFNELKDSTSRMRTPSGTTMIKTIMTNTNNGIRQTHAVQILTTRKTHCF